MMMSGLIQGGNMTSVETGRERLVALKELVQPRLYAAHQQLGAALATGEVDIALNYKARGLQWIGEGSPLATQYPKEGAIAITFGAGMPKRAPNLDGAYVYLNAMLDRKAMAELAAASFYAPANGAAELSPELRARIDFSPRSASTSTSRIMPTSRRTPPSGSSGGTKRWRADPMATLARSEVLAPDRAARARPRIPPGVGGVLPGTRWSSWRFSGRSPSCSATASTGSYPVS